MLEGATGKPPNVTRDCPECERELEPVDVKTGQFQSDLRVAAPEQGRLEGVFRSGERSAQGYLCPECGQLRFFVGNGPSGQG